MFGGSVGCKDDMKAKRVQGSHCHKNLGIHSIRA